MKKAAQLFWTEPAVFLSVAAAATQVAVFWPDWRAGLTALATLLAGGATRTLVSPKRGA